MTKLGQLTLCALLSMFAGSALAYDLVLPDPAQRRGMSYEEYSSIRQKMRQRIGGTAPAANNKQQPVVEQKPAEPQDDSGLAEGSYGRDFQSRNRMEDRPSQVKIDRPERPQFNRPERPDVFRR